MEEVIMAQLDKYAQTGELPVHGYLFKPIVDLTELHPLFLSEIVSSASGAYATEAEFLKYLYLADRKFFADIKNKEDPLDCNWSPGRLFGKGYTVGKPFGPYGISNSDVMIIVSTQCSLFTKENSRKSSASLTPIASGIRDKFRSTLESIGFTELEIANWYITSLVKFSRPNAEETIPASWISGCFPWLLQEIYLLKPKYIICVGATVLKKFKGTSATLKKYNGLLSDCTIDIATGITHNCKLLALPAFGTEVDLDVIPHWKRQLTLLYNDLHGVQKEDTFKERHVAVHNATGLYREILRIKELAKADPHRRIIAVDLEWEGEYPEQEGAHVLTVQFSSFPGEATVVLLTDNDGVVFEEGLEVASKLLSTILIEDGDWKPRLGGHFLRADMPWLISLGIDEKGLKHAYQPAETPEACRDEGGWDTGLMYHAYREAEEIGDGYGLKVLALKECGVERYDVKLQEEYNAYASCTEEKEHYKSKLSRARDLLARIKDKYKRDKVLKAKYKPYVDILTEYISVNKEKLKSIPNKRIPKGFGCISMPTLKKYAAWDADATRRLAELCLYGLNGRQALLDSDGYGNSCWEPFWRAHRASWGFGEMERTGFVLDMDRLGKLSCLFQEAYNILLSSFQDDINWPDFNPNSSDNRRGLLFGLEFSRKKDGTYSMPEDAKSFNLTPIRATDKTEWESIDEEDVGNYSASTDSLSLSIFAQENPEVRKFYDLCKLGRALAGNIRPAEDSMDANGNTTLTWKKGISTYLHPDGRVHTHLSQTKKTGRASSFDPPMQNIGKSAEALLQTTLGYRDKDGEVIANYLDLFGEPRYLYPCRTILRAAPGRVLIESDFTGAELAVMAWASQDPHMIEHVKMNALPEDDPNYYDIHSHIAVKAFHLDCEPTKKGLASIHKKHLRVAAKSVVFGIPYGRSVKAILLQCQANGVYLSEEEGDALLNSYFELYPKTKVFLQKCKDDVKNHKFVKTLFNRCRRFSKYLRNADLAKAQREACNAPIQGTVADSINNAIFNLLEFREAHPEYDFTLNMQIHDALVLECRYEQVKSMKQIIHKCMVEDNPVVVEGVPHYYGLDSECYVHWGEELTDEISKREFGVPLSQIL